MWCQVVRHNSRNVFHGWLGFHAASSYVGSLAKCIYKGWTQLVFLPLTPNSWITWPASQLSFVVQQRSLWQYLLNQSINLKHMCKDNSINYSMNLVASFTPSHCPPPLTQPPLSPFPTPPPPLSLSPPPLSPPPLPPLTERAHRVLLLLEED